jgi:hypothetical protein
MNIILWILVIINDALLSGSPAAEEWRVMCGGETATHHPPIPSSTKQLQLC